MPIVATLAIKNLFIVKPFQLKDRGSHRTQVSEPPVHGEDRINKRPRGGLTTSACLKA